MNIQSINLSASNNNNTRTNFKSAFPVVHWVAESNGSYAPVGNMKLLKKLQGRIVRMLNRDVLESKKPINPIEERLRSYLSRCDLDYRKNAIVRSFYNATEAMPNRYTPFTYMISGEDVNVFEDRFGKNIGKNKKLARETQNSIYTPEVNEAISLYNHQGLNFVKNNPHQIKDEKGMKYMLHTKFEIVRNKLGKIKDYKFIEARFMPVNGDKNSLGRM